MEEVQKQSAETTDSVAEAVDTGASEIADASNDVVFSEGGKEEVSAPTQKPEKKPQKTNADYARERRKAEHEAALKKARNDAILEALNGENPFTNEKMVDEADIQEYLTMKEIERNGGDPISDYSKHLKNKEKEKAKIIQEDESQKDWVQKDKKSFLSKYPDVDLDALLNDDLFRTFAFGKVGRIGMDKIYSDYQAFTAKSEERAKERTAQILANNAATPGKLSNQSALASKNVQDMTKAELEKMVERIKRGEKF